MGILKHALNLAKAKFRDQITGGKRSSKWPKVKDEHLKQFPKCAACGETRKLNVHHKKPFHLHPDLELNPDNLITLCMQNDCHILIGHGDDFKAYNPDVVTDAGSVATHTSDVKTAIQEAAVKAKAERLFE
jgi:anaerobic ribonucleoside-triphosphate reductase